MGSVEAASGNVSDVASRARASPTRSERPTGGVYVVSGPRPLPLRRGSRRRAGVTWREAYENTLQEKPGQVDDGSGTTPTLMGKGLIAITDNADPMNVTVYRRGRGVSGSRLVCREPVFSPGQSATDNSLNAIDRSIIVVENNYGYSGPMATSDGKRHLPRLRACGRAPPPPRLPQRLAQRGDRPERRAEASLGAGLSTPTRSRRSRTTRGTSRPSTSAPARPSTRSSPARASASTTTTRP